MSIAQSSSQPLSWRRVGALSTSFILHTFVAALALLAIARTASDPLPIIVPPTEPMQVEIISKPLIVPVPERVHTPPEVQAVRVTQPVRTPRVEPVATRTEVMNPSHDSPMAIETPTVSPVPVTPTIEPSVSTGASYENVSLPGYPAIARKQGLRGETLLRVLVGASGAAERIEVSRSSGHRILDRTAIASVRTWRFKPALENGVAIASWVEVPVSFRLDAR